MAQPTIRKPSRSLSVASVKPNQIVRSKGQAATANSTKRKALLEQAAENGDLTRQGVRDAVDGLEVDFEGYEQVLHALAHKIKAVNTNERLKALAEKKHMTIVDSRNLVDALHFIQQVRIKHQCEQIVRGEKVSNYINPRDLPKMAKEQLRDAFTIIDEAQSAVRQTYRAGMG